jgi:predicted DNA-binding protein
MDIPKGRKPPQFPEQVITRISTEARVKLDRIKEKTGASEADVLRAAVDKFIEIFEEEERKKAGK